MPIPNDIRRYQYGNFFNRAREWVSDNTVKFSENSKGTAEPGMYFQSSYAKNNLNHPTGEFEVAQFHFHHKSEHTIAGEHFDLELHIVHLSNTKD